MKDFLVLASAVLSLCASAHAGALEGRGDHHRRWSPPVTSTIIHTQLETICITPEPVTVVETVVVQKTTTDVVTLAPKTYTSTQTGTITKTLTDTLTETPAPVPVTLATTATAYKTEWKEATPEPITIVDTATMVETATITERTDLPDVTETETRTDTTTITESTTVVETVTTEKTTTATIATALAKRDHEPPECIWVTVTIVKKITKVLPPVTVCKTVTVEAWKTESVYVTPAPVTIFTTVYETEYTTETTETTLVPETTYTTQHFTNTIVVEKTSTLEPKQVFTTDTVTSTTTESTITTGPPTSTLTNFITATSSTTTTSTYTSTTTTTKTIVEPCIPTDWAQRSIIERAKILYICAPKGGLTEIYYRQTLDVACLRVARGEAQAESYCGDIWGSQVTLPESQCVNRVQNGDFDLKVMDKYLTSIYDVMGREALLQVHGDTVRRFFSEELCLPPSLSLLQTISGADAERTAIEYIKGYSVSEDLQEHIREYIQNNVNASPQEAVLNATAEVLYAHSSFYNCGVSPSIALQALRNFSNVTSTSVNRAFVPIYAEQLRDNYIIAAARGVGVPLTKRDLYRRSAPLRRRDITEYDANLVGGDLPLDPNLQNSGDTRNILKEETFTGYEETYDPNLSGILNGLARNNTELSLAAEQFDPNIDEVTVQSGAQPYNRITIDPDQTRSETDLQAAVAQAASIPVRLTLREAEETSITPEKPYAYIYVGDPNTGLSRTVLIASDVFSIWKATTDLSPQLDNRAFAQFPGAGGPQRMLAMMLKKRALQKREITEKVPEEGRVCPPDPNDSTVLYRSASVRLDYDISLLRDYDDSVNETNVYLLDVLTGKEIESTKTSTGDSSGFMSAVISEGNGVYGCGWSGGGSFAVGIRGWTPEGGQEGGDGDGDGNDTDGGDGYDNGNGNGNPEDGDGDGDGDGNGGVGPLPGSGASTNTQSSILALIGAGMALVLMF